MKFIKNETPIDAPKKRKASAGCAPVSGSAAVVWSRTQPAVEGWWWMDRNEVPIVVKLQHIRARGNLLCAWLPTFGEWMRVDEVSNDVIPCRWAGPIAIPSEPPNAAGELRPPGQKP